MSKKEELTELEKSCVSDLVYIIGGAILIIFGIFSLGTIGI
ncbi:hypothetical protein [Helicobacter monodelphidis]|nr:hypothetical protein [Helicobacter sp. 15-1451]